MKKSLIALAAQYALSKRTSLYAGYHGTRTSCAVLPRLDTHLYTMGVSHSF